MKLLTIDMKARKAAIAKREAAKRKVAKAARNAIHREYRIRGRVTKVLLAREAIINAEEEASEGYIDLPFCDWYAPWRSGHIGSFRNAKRNQSDRLRSIAKRQIKNMRGMGYE